MDKRSLLCLSLSIMVLALPILFRALLGRLVWLNWNLLDWLLVLFLGLALALAFCAFPGRGHVVLKVVYSSYITFLLAVTLCSIYQAATDNWSVKTLDSSKNGVEAALFKQHSDCFEYLICYKVLIPRILGFQLVRVNVQDVANHFDSPEYCQIISDREIVLSLHERRYKVRLDEENEIDASQLVESAAINN
ncbi:MAG: hypothetical protein JNN26_00555 [Candidatus Obscuribacter sp.]|nr:hypothetical protein [Candidatus Obscuribacter sp.]